jgi:hypothetical protein
MVLLFTTCDITNIYETLYFVSVLFPDACKNKKFDLCVLDVDMFHYLVALVMSLPSLHLDTSVAPSNYLQLPSGGDNELHALHLVLAVHLIQILLLYDQGDCGIFIYFLPLF